MTHPSRLAKHLGATVATTALRQVMRALSYRVFPFDATNEALAYVEAGRAKGKVVVKVR